MNLLKNFNIKTFYTIGICAFGVVTLMDLIGLVYTINTALWYSSVTTSAMTVFHAGLAYFFYYLYKQQNTMQDTSSNPYEDKEMVDIINKVSEEFEDTNNNMKGGTLQ